ncbi:cytochrome P450 2K1-like isoform X1 [Scleropages formosus]|uniref:cytochrome P450 2K1-like isoform X1 n=1 Tax=Scleropages formosus TaxID=113540 RepID=UPI0010FAB69D|nr:cytochrome P450 2K1-like isoform X1 [Scleropages formosus]
MALLEGLIQTHSSTALFGAFIVLGVIYFLSTTSKQGKEPPGPRSLPLIGNLLQLDLKRPHVSLFQLSKKYGSVFTVHFGPKKVVVLAGFRAVKDALVNYSEEFGGRDITPVFYKTSHNHGILFANGESWKEMRRFALTSLRDFGMGKRIIEEKIINEIDYMIQLFGNHKGQPFDNKEALNHAVSNIISSIVYGARFDYSDPLFQEMVHCANERIRLTGTPAIQVYNMFPWLGPLMKDWRDLVKNLKISEEHIRGLVKKLQNTLNTKHRRCFVDSFLFQQQEVKVQEKCEQNSFFSEKNLVCSVSNLFAAGTETTAATLRWGLLLMAKYPHVQDRVQEELIRVTGSRQPRVEDRKNLPYTNAVIHEIQRMANIVPMSIPHITTCDVVFQGFHIKKGTSVYPLLTSVLFDENEWETPHTFNPGHFLDEQGQFVKKDAFLPFSAGRRVCLGESLARMELFLVFTSLLQKFNFTPPPGVSESELDLTPAIGFTLNTPPHKLCAVSLA